MGGTWCKEELEPFSCSGIHYRTFDESSCGVRDDPQDSSEELPSFYPSQDALSDMLEDEPVCSLDLDVVSRTLFSKSLRWEGWRAQPVLPEIAGTPIPPEPFSDEEDDEEANLVHVHSDMAEALQDNGDNKSERTFDSAQSNGREAAVLIVDLDSWERASEKNTGAQPTLLWPDKAAMCVESVREATEKVVVDVDTGTDDVKQTPNLAFLASDVDQNCIPCNISDTTDSNCSALSRRLYVPKVTEFLNSLSTCGSDSSSEEDQSACLRQVSIDNETESVDSKILDGLWMLDDGELVAVVKGSDVKFLGDGAGISGQLQALDGGVWAITMDDEEFLGDCSKREDGRLLLHWSDGLTWVRKEEGIAIDTVSKHEEKLQEKCQSIASFLSSSWSSSSSSSSSSYSSDSSLSAWSSGEAAEASKVIETDVADLEDRICKINQADIAGGVCKVDTVGQARRPSKADKTGGAGDASKTTNADDMNQDGQICKARLANVEGDGAVADQFVGEDIKVRKLGGAVEADDTSTASKTIENDNVNMDGKFNEAGQVSQVGKAGEIIEGEAVEAVQS